MRKSAFSPQNPARGPHCYDRPSRPNPGQNPGQKRGAIFSNPGRKSPKKRNFTRTTQNSQNFSLSQTSRNFKLQKKKFLGVLGDIRRIWLNFKFSTSFRAFCPLFAPWFFEGGVPPFLILATPILECPGIRLSRTKSKPKRRILGQFSPRGGWFFFTIGCPFLRSASPAGAKMENLRGVGKEAAYTKLLDVGLGAGPFHDRQGRLVGSAKRWGARLSLFTIG